MPVKRIICLANSRKLNGRCVAGKESGEGGGWIRPISAREQQEVSEYERQYVDGGDPQVLDVIDVPLIESRATGYQQENWLLDPRQDWTKIAKANWTDLADIEDATPVDLWINGTSSYAGRNDRIALSAAAALKSSLRLIRVQEIELHVIRPGEAFGNNKRRVQGRFCFRGNDYWLWVTDPSVERAYLAKADGRYELGERYLTISLGEPFQDHCYKLIAAIIPPPILPETP